MDTAACTHPIWRIFLFGGLRAEPGSPGGGGEAQVITRFRSQKMGALLAYLALFPKQLHSREELADLFWAEASPEAGRTNLRTALSALRRQLEPAGVPAGAVLTTIGNFQVGLDPAAITTDVADFDAALQAAAACPATEKISKLSEAVALYQGPLLPGFYDTWVIAERDRLNEMYLTALRSVIRLLEQAGEYKAALSYARRAVAADMLGEGWHADVIRLLMATGQAAAAHRQFDELERLLRNSFGTEPLPETRALLKSGRRPASVPAGETPSLSALTQPRFSTAAAETAAVGATFPFPSLSGGAAASGMAPAAVPGGATAVMPRADVSPLHLPVTMTRFFGREKEMAQLREALQGSSGGGRLVTLSGAGGSGKTRLAIETARQLTGHFAGGIWFVPLADLREAEQIPDFIAKAMLIPRSASVSALEQVVEALALRGERAPTLLLLDNFEQVVEKGSAIVHQLLSLAPTLSCLVTSRQRLLLDGEQDVPLLPLPTPSHPGNPERLLEFPSVQLFVSRSQSARPDFQLRAQNAESVAELCTRLEGIPLALELAAAWSQTLTPAQMLERMQNRFDLLVARRRDVAGRHATLRATVEWSYQLLPVEVRRFFAQLSAFHGGWTLEAAEVVTGEPQALVYLTELRERSLILAAEEQEWPSRLSRAEEADEMPEATDTLRFRMLETLREFAHEQVGDENERTRLSERHYDYFVRFAEEAEPCLRSNHQALYLRRLEAEHANLRAALQWSYQTNSTTAALRLASALGWFWVKRSHFREGRDWLQTLLKATENEPSSIDRLQSLQHIGVLTYWQADYETSRHFFEESLQMSKELHSEGHQSFAWFGLAITAMNAGRIDETITCAQKGLTFAEGDNDPFLFVRPLVALAYAEMLKGDLPLALEHIGRYTAFMRAAGDKWEVAIGLTTRGVFCRYLNQNEEADACFREGILLSQELEDVQGQVFGIRGMAGVACVMSQPKRAARLFGAVERFTEVLHSSVPQIWDVLFERDLPLVKSALGPEIFAALWDEGRNLSLEQAVEYARETLLPVS